MRIPKTINLIGRTIKVIEDKKLIHDNEWLGCAIYRENKIKLQPSTKERPLSKESIGSTYCHELVHWVLYSMGKHELNKDEEFVDLFGSLLHQALDSAKYD